MFRKSRNARKKTFFKINVFFSHFKLSTMTIIERNSVLAGTLKKSLNKKLPVIIIK
jgi:hypothetical protein